MLMRYNSQITWNSFLNITLFTGTLWSQKVCEKGNRKSEQISKLRTAIENNNDKTCNYVMIFINMNG